MNKSLVVEVKNIYGRNLFYPFCDDSQLICKIAGTKTLSPEVIEILRANHYAIKIKGGYIEDYTS